MKKKTEKKKRTVHDTASDKEKSVDLSDMPPLGDDEEEAKEGKGLEILTPSKLLTRLPI